MMLLFGLIDGFSSTRQI